MRISWLACVAVVGSSAVFMAVAANSPVPATEPQAKPSKEVHWREPLQWYGERFSFYFTIERDDIGKKDSEERPLVSRSVQMPDEMVTDPAKALALLRSWIPEADITADASDAKLFHILEKSIKARKDYLLDVTTTMEFKGTLEDFVEDLTERTQGSLRWSGASVLSVGSSHFNLDSPVEIKRENRTYRDLLDAATPRTTNRILWETCLSENNGKVVALLMPSIGRLLPTSSLPATTSSGAPAQTGR